MSFVTFTPLYYVICIIYLLYYYMGVNDTAGIVYVIVYRCRVYLTKKNKYIIQNLYSLTYIEVQNFQSTEV